MSNPTPTAHTEGPWEPREVGQTGRWLIDAPGCRFIATVDAPPGDEARAIAHLIAAAPSLLKALERLWRAADALDRAGLPEAYEQADEAIARAKAAKP